MPASAGIFVYDAERGIGGQNRFEPEREARRPASVAKLIPTEYLTKDFDASAGIFIYGSSGGNEKPRLTALA